jgi:beta-lactamase regulating signal transducer with metallopeptidase domain
VTLLVASAVKSTVVLGLALAAARCMRAAALRHATVAAAVGCAAVLPLVSLVVPHWSPAALFGPRATFLSTGWTTSLDPWLLPAWAAGAALCTAGVIARVLRLARLAARCDEIGDGALADMVLDISAEYRLAYPVTILRDESGTLLGTCGVAPRVIVPRLADTWDAERLESVLRHELAHVRRRDWLIQTAAESVRALYWFNPLVWIACRMLRIDGEHACDAEVIRAGVDGHVYAAHLVDVARALRPQNARWPAAAMTGASTLERRVRAILRVRAPRVSRPWTLAAATVAIAAATLLLALVGRPSRPEQIIVPNPRAQKLTLMLDGQIVDLSQGWPSTPDPNAGLVPGRGVMLAVQAIR